jgi:AraC-like DNA-binding protein
MLICKAILGQDWVPHCAYFTYPEPQPIDRMLYSQRFGPSLQFNADFNGFATSVADLDRVRAGADPALLRHAETLVDLALGPAEMTFSRTVRQALMHLLGSSEATLASTAAALGLHPRTLQRHLQDEGVSFRTLVNQTRMQLAVRLLANPAARIADVADALGYSSTGAFSRWHRQAFGRPPTHQR